ncbi:alpha/beta hydrolase [Candidatus Nitrotoga arctica]|uniref:Lysophospholipase n=1 Tax=Candidatus Nitrotoga arctica TaxID=453162 RepID=A0ABM8YVE8_9PROT|nr:alpha/beta fold hydrolase [Candidatus Nitrotoga arctica]CAG9931456.1 Lysophospholipase [Candidatus Nitrotoga arctica]
MNQFNSMFLAGLLLLLQACGATPPLGARHQPSGLNTQFNSDQLAFSDYVADSRAMITKVRAGSNVTELEKVVNGNVPFELKPAESCPKGREKPYRRGVLLTHALTDAPYSMHSLASFFQENCFRVMAVLLPGHGTQPGDLLDVTWQEWAKAEAYGTDKLAAEADEIYLAGFSTGGTLSVYQALGDNRVRGLFLFSPALKVTPMASLATVHKIYSWLMPSAKWVSIMPDKAIYRYESFPKNAAAQVYTLIQKVQAQLHKHEVNIPIFTAASQDDTTVYTSATLDFMAHAHHESNKLVLYTADTKKIPPNIPAGNLELVNSIFPEQKILSSAHTSMTLPSEDAYYGIKGAYSNCIHYYPDDIKKYDACNQNPEQDLQGELTEENLKAGTLRRLMYNPNFSTLKISMKKFIDGLP